MAQSRRFESLMGTEVDIHVRTSPFDEIVLEGVIDVVVDRLRDIDETFSTYDPHSVISRFGRGEIAYANLTTDVQLILQMCDDLHATTNGYFNVRAAAAAPSPAATYQMPSRAIEPSGVVKGWALEQAVQILRMHDLRDFCVNIGGDLYASGEFEPGSPWMIGLQHPFEKHSAMATLAVSDLAVATSGLYERGDHIALPEGVLLSSDEPSLLSMTVVGPDITLVDAYATAAFAMGIAGMEWIVDMPGFDVFAVDTNETTHHSAGMNELLVNAGRFSVSL